jgi:hypothetical protein
MWNIEMVRLLRNLVADWGTGSPAGEPTVYTYSDNRLQEIILLSAQLVQQEVPFTDYYTSDISSMTLDPDPTLDEIRDDGFINLTLLKAACIVDNAAARLAASRGVVMRDAGKEIDLRTVSQSMLVIWQKGWCQNYQDARLEFLYTDASSAGAAIIGPFREYLNTPAGPWNPDGYDIAPIGTAVYGGYQSNMLNDGRYR